MSAEEQTGSPNKRDAGAQVRQNREKFSLSWPMKDPKSSCIISLFFIIYGMALQCEQAAVMRCNDVAWIRDSAFS